jgi:hypothetical protein
MKFQALALEIGRVTPTSLQLCSGLLMATAETFSLACRLEVLPLCWLE